MLGDENSDGVTASFFGDGTCNVGQFYESLNMAALYKLPHIFVVENNKCVQLMPLHLVYCPLTFAQPAAA